MYIKQIKKDSCSLKKHVKFKNCSLIDSYEMKKKCLLKGCIIESELNVQAN